jgi:pentapeptide MXKDX repeat protein
MSLLDGPLSTWAGNGSVASSGRRQSRRLDISFVNARSLNMRKIWQWAAVVVLGFGLGLAVVGCGSWTTTGKDKMGGDKMGDKMKDDKMKDDKMKDDKMKDDKMKDDKMKDDKMKDDKM